MKKLTLIIPLVVLAACAALKPGSDPFVVRVEQTQTAANASFDFVLMLDNADRGFWRTNAPAFHNFCEWGRTPLPYMGSDHGGAYPRFVVMQLNVDDLKTAYKDSKTMANSNALYRGWTVLNAAFGQANSWSNIVKSPTH